MTENVMAKQTGVRREITRVWRHQQENRAVVEYNEITEDHVMGQKAQDHTLPPTQSFHDAMDGLKTFIATPYGISGTQADKVRPRELRLTGKEGDDGKEILQCNLHGTRHPEGFDANVQLRVPKQEVTGGLKKAADLVVKEALAYIEGARGQVPMGLGEE